MPRPALYKQIRPIAKKARKQGWEIERTRGGHTLWISPGGARLYTSSTPSDGRAFKNFVAELRRAGFRG
jgi:hypothetical protein